MGGNTSIYPTGELSSLLANPNITVGDVVEELYSQIYDMKVDSRKGEWTPLMKPVVAKLNEDDLIAIGAYVASIQ